MNGLSTVRYVPIEDKMFVLPIMRKCAELYCRIWKEPPWEESYWIPPMFMAQIRTAFARRGYVGLLALCADNPGVYASVVGFIWGYLARSGDITDVSSNQCLPDSIFRLYPEVFYLAELGVDPAYRNRGIGTQLSRDLIDKLKGQGSQPISLRTHIDDIPGRNIYAGLGFEELPIADRQFSPHTYWLLAPGK